jgi:hypothetical protein
MEEREKKIEANMRQEGAHCLPDENARHTLFWILEP